ncbi:MAG: hypothetical protein KHY83_05405, partial [Coriobacteriia bacterium]|nr:hypothetical protein [Coriobacteriia bacterium]
MNAKRNATSAFGKQGALAGTVALASIATLGLAGHITLASEAAGTIQANAPGAEASVREAPTWNAPTSLRSIHDIQGAFAWDQGVNTDNASLSKSLYGASRVLCGAQVDEANAGGLSREVETEGTVDAICQILVNGNVANPGAYDVGQLEDQAPV